MRYAMVCLGTLLLCMGPVAAQRVRDSAGIRIVENSQPALAQNRMWRIDPQHFLQIGGGESDDSVYEFLRIAGLARLSDGRIAVANQGSHTVRFFDAQGQYLAAFGREGDGPGEFRQILGLKLLPGDSLSVTDLTQINFYTGQGRFVRSLSIMARGARIYPSALLGDGSYFGFASRPGSRMEPRGGRWVDSQALLRVGPDPATLDTVGRFPIYQASFSASARGQLAVVFGPRFKLAASERELYAGFPSRYEIHALTWSGDLKRILRRSGALRRTAAAEIAAHKEWMVNQPGEDGRPAPPRMKAYWSRLADETAFAAELPAFSTLLVDRTGHLWVREYEPEEETYRPGPISIRTISKRTHWDVFTPEGRWLGRVELPASFTPLEIGADYVAGLWRNADDVEHVRFYRLLKP